MIKHERNRNLVDYFKKNLAKGYPAESLKWALLNQGYMRPEVLAALGDATREIAEKAPKLEEKPKIKYEIVEEEEHPVNLSLWGKIKSWFG